MKTMCRFLLVGMTLSIVSGCYAPRGSGNDPVAGAALGVAGLVDAKNTRSKQKEKEQQKAVNEYLDKKAQ